MCIRDNTEGVQRNGGGKHCVAIVDSRVVCTGLGEGGERVADVMWLTHSSSGRLTTQAGKGYMRQIGSIYEFSSPDARPPRFHVPEPPPRAPPMGQQQDEQRQKGGFRAALLRSDHQKQYRNG